MSSSALSTMPTHHQPSIKPVRVLISAASSITRAGLERLLEKQPSVQLVGAIRGADGLPPAIAENDPDGCSCTSKLSHRRQTGKN